MADGLRDWINYAPTHILLGASKGQPLRITKEIKMEELHQFPRTHDIGRIEARFGKGQEIEIEQALGKLISHPFCHR